MALGYNATMPDEQRDPPKPKTTAANKQDRCFECNYPLRGLPERHKCPECGGEYDLRTLVWRPRRSWTVVFAQWFVIVLLARESLGLLDQFDLTSPRTVLRIVFLFVIFSVFVSSIRGMWRLLRLGRFAAVSPDGIRVRTKDLDMTWAWDEIDHVVGGAEPVEIVTGPMNERIAIRWVFNNEKERSDFVMAANRNVSVEVRDANAEALRQMQSRSKASEPDADG